MIEHGLKARKVVSLEEYAVDRGKLATPIPATPRWQQPRIAHLVIFILLLGLILILFNVYELRAAYKDHIHVHQVPQTKRPASSPVVKNIVWIHAKKLESGYLNHVIRVFEKIDYQMGQTNWSVLWSHNYPFNELASEMHSLHPHQKVNHFPGSGYITNKVSLAVSTTLKHIPAAFKIPSDKDKLLKYAKKYPGKMWVQKSNGHRGISVDKIGDLDLEADGTFVQEFISNPLLIDGRKFDIGVYTILSGINPLRVYIYNGDVLLRFCSKKYYPFDALDLETYVVGDDYLPVWKVPTIARYFKDLKCTMKESLNAVLLSQGKNPAVIWNQIAEAIQNVYFEKEPALIKAASTYKATRNFFEMVRFDFVIDEDLNVFLMEANMSPNLSSAHFPTNKLLYEQVIYSLLSLAGLTKVPRTSFTTSLTVDEENMLVSDSDILVSSVNCSSDMCWSSCQNKVCRLCNRCLKGEDKRLLKDVYLEHINQHNCRRIIPSSTIFNMTHKSNTSKMYLSERNEFLAQWFAGKCLQDSSWCS